MSERANQEEGPPSRQKHRGIGKRAPAQRLHLEGLCTSEEASSPEQRLSDLPHRTILTTAADSGGVEGGGGGSTNRR